MIRSYIVITLSLMMIAHAASKEPSYTGTYKLKWTKKRGCILKTQKLNDSKLRMQLSCQDDSNSGLALGVLDLNNNVAMFKREVSGLCEISFAFKEKSVEVIQKGMDVYCGFGMGIYVDGNYLIQSNKTPKFDYK